MKQRKVIIATHRKAAETLRDVFGLSPDEWACIGAFDATMGSIFDVVVMLPYAGNTFEQSKFNEWYLASVCTRTHEGTRLVLP